MKSSYILLVLISLYSIASSFAQDINQKVAIKDFKAGTHKNWAERGSYTTAESGTRDVSYKYDDNGDVSIVILGGLEYELSHVKDYYGNKIYTGTHFHNDSRHFNIIILNGKLYIFSLYADDTFQKINGIVGKKGGSTEKPIKVLKAYAIKMEAAKQEKEKELKAITLKKNPESFYKEVSKESEGLRKVETKQGKVGFINSEGDIVIETKYDRSYKFFENGLMGVEIDGKQGYINKEDKVIIQLDNINVKEIYNGLILVQETKSEYNLYNLNGKIAFGPYDYSAIRKDQSSIYVRDGSNHGWIGSDQKVDWLLKGKDYFSVIRYKEFYKVVKNSKAGLYDPSTNKEILEPIYDQIYDEKEGCYVVKHNGKFGLFNGRKKCFITEVIYKDAFSFKNGKAKIEQDGSIGYADTDGNILWNDKTKTKGVINSGHQSSWRRQYEESGALIVGEYSKISKGGLYGYVNDNGDLKLPIKYSSASAFQNGMASVVENGKAKQINTSGVVQEYTPGLGNSIEMSFSYAHNDAVSFHFGVIWDKKTGDNKLYYSNDIYQYNFKGSESWVLPKGELLSIIDTRGDILMKAQAFIEQDKNNRKGTEILVWNTFTGKYLVYEYDNGFKIKSKMLDNSPYMSSKGGRIMYDYEVDYAQGIEGYGPKFGYLVWNTLTGKNNLVNKGESPFSFDPEIDGELMMDFDLAIESDYNSRGGYIYAYTTKTLIRKGFYTYSGKSGYSSFGVEKIEKFVKQKGENEYDFQVNMSSMYRYKTSSLKKPVMIILNKKSENINIGLGFPGFIKFKDELLELPRYDYAGICENTNEIGMFQITNEQKGKLEYWFWDKTTGDFRVCLYTNNNGTMDFVTPFSVYDNLLALDWDDIPNVSGGELSADQLEAGSKPKPVKNTASNNSSSSSDSENTSSDDASSGPKLVQISVNPNGKAKSFVHIHWTENGRSKKKTLQTRSTGVIGKIPEETKLYYSIDNESSKTFFYQVPMGKTNASVTIK